MLKPCCFWGDGLPQNSLLIVLMRRLFSVFFFSSNLEKVSGVPSSLGLRDNKQSIFLRVHCGARSQINRDLPSPLCKGFKTTTTTYVSRENVGPLFCRKHNSVISVLQSLNMTDSSFWTCMHIVKSVRRRLTSNATLCDVRCDYVNALYLTSCSGAPLARARSLQHLEQKPCHAGFP